jgi:signal transduction histidine kinase
MKSYAVFARLFAGAMIITTWGLTDSPLSGVAFVLILTALSAVRYRFAPFKLLGIAEVAVCLGFSFVWLPALLGLWLPLVGLLEDKWRVIEQELLMKDHENRAERLKLEKQSQAAAHDKRTAEQSAQINERARIAQDIHDHVGHEVTGALIALQTALTLHESGDKRTGELLSKTISRLESASINLRETVHNLKPVKKSGVEILEELCSDFEFCRINFAASGEVAENHAKILSANLKEALTNISRHSNATNVKVKIESNDNYVRMTISDNGQVKQNLRHGMGLTGMKERVRAANGTFSVSTDSGFKITCMLPRKDSL